MSGGPREWLRVQSEVMAGLVGARGLADAGPRLLDILGEELDCDLATLWQMDPAGDALRAGLLWHRPDARLEGFQSATRRARFRCGEGLPGAVWESGQVLLVEDVTRCPGFLRADSAAEHDLRGAAFFPLGTATKVHAAIELFTRSRGAFDPELGQALTLIGRHVGELLERLQAESALRVTETRSREELDRLVAERTEALEHHLGTQRRVAEAELRRSRAKLQRLFESDVLGILIADTAGRIYEANDALLRMLGRSRSEVEAGALRWDDFTPPEWREVDARAAARLTEDGCVSAYEKEFLCSDGTRVPVLIGAAMLEGSAADCIGFVVDIRGRKEAERAVVRLNETLEARVEERTRKLSASERRAERAAAKVAHSERRLRALASRMENVREAERKQLAREIHDVVGQELTGLKMDAAWVLRRLTHPERYPEAQSASAERLRSMLQQLDSSIETVRAIATRLRPGVLDDLGLLAALEWQAKAFQKRSGLPVEIDLPADDVGVGSGQSTALFRIFQELLTNVARHAQARSVRVRLERSRDSVILEVCDDGVGITLAQIEDSGSLGLLGMRERVQAFGGGLELTDAPAGGTLARVTMPLWTEGKTS